VKPELHVGSIYRLAIACSLVTAIVALTLARPSSTIAKPIEPQLLGPMPPGEYIVMFQPGSTEAARALLVTNAGGLVRFNYTVADAVAMTVSNPNVILALLQDRSVMSIIPDRRMSAIGGQLNIGGTNSAAAASTQVVPAGVQRVGPPTSSSNGSGIGVAIVDTGMDLAHKDLAPAAERYSALGNSCQDDNGHGTHVTGIVAALNNTIDVVGVAPNAKPYCVKVLDSTATGADSSIMAGLDWIFNNYARVNPRIRVVNMSLGRQGTLDDNPALRAAVRRLYDLGIVMVVAAGNDSSLEVTQRVPAGYPEVLAVASTAAVDGSNRCLLSKTITADTASSFSTDGKYNPSTRIGITISAPGEENEDVSLFCQVASQGILSTHLGGGTTRLSGTSMATAHVTGIIARLMQSGVAGPENIRGILRASANRVGIAPFDSPTAGYTYDGEREGIAKAP
jgi:subtilisin family serine protease